MKRSSEKGESKKVYSELVEGWSSTVAAPYGLIAKESSVPLWG